MELLNHIQEKQNDVAKKGRPVNNPPDSPRRNWNSKVGSSKHRSGRISSKLSLLELLFKNDIMDNVCPMVEVAENIQSLFASLSQMAMPESAHRRKGYSRRSDAMLQQLKECCALNTTDEVVDCMETIAQTIIDGKCDLQEGGFR